MLSLSSGLFVKAGSNVADRFRAISIKFESFCSYVAQSFGEEMAQMYGDAVYLAIYLEG